MPRVDVFGGTANVGKRKRGIDGVRRTCALGETFGDTEDPPTIEDGLYGGACVEGALFEEARVVVCYAGTGP
jgi:hypothetical protein